MRAKPPQRNAKGTGFSRLIINLATAAVCISVAVMIIATAIVKGYQHEVRNKIIGFNSQIQVSHLDLNNSYESLPIDRDTLFEYLAKKKSAVIYMQRIASKAGIIKTETAFEGIVLKGVDVDYDWSFLKKHLQTGNAFQVFDTVTGNQILISAITAKRLGFKLGDPVVIYFVQEPLRVRKFKISGIFDTGMGDLDEIYAFVDIKQVQKLNNWEKNQISGYEIGLNQGSDIEQERNNLAAITPYEMGLKSIFEMYPALFDWLNLLDMNVLIIIVLMIAVASINMITALLILILERMQMVGTLKALGGTDTQISKIFLYMAANIIAKGLLFGNILGIGLAMLQQYYGFLKLDQSAYYLNRVPIELLAGDVIWINLGSFVICMCILLIPSRFVSRILPVKTINFN